ncbi:MAG: hypothetical protein ACLTXL_06395 [Clostridia bacterium]
MFDFSNCMKTSQVSDQLEKPLCNTLRRRRQSSTVKLCGTALTDRAAQTRQRMHTDVKRIDTGIRIIWHTAYPTGSMELAHERYAVIYPTLLKEGPGVMRHAKSLTARIVR